VVRVAHGERPTWSPTGRRIAVEDSGLGGVKVIRLDRKGGIQNVLRDEGAGDTSKGEPAWSPDGRRLAYTNFIDTAPSYELVCLIRLKPPRRHRCLVKGSAPSWSPDGRLLIFECGRGICTMRTDGRRKRMLAERGKQPKFSPDGRRVVYCLRIGGQPPAGDSSQRGCGGRSDIYVMNTPALAGNPRPVGLTSTTPFGQSIDLREGVVFGRSR
jgi:Tol biopolymer transport system component